MACAFVLFYFLTYLYFASVGFGLVPFTFNIQEGMQEPQDMRKATQISHWGVFITYILMGEGIAIIFRPTMASFQGDILSELPSNSVMTQFLRLAMSIVIFATIPLITVPTGDLIYGKLPMSVKGDNAGRITTSIRIMVCLVSAYVSVAVPDFVSAISFTGCLCVASLSFVYPPLVHLVLRYKFCRQKKNRIFCSDILLLLWGIVATAVSTTLTFQSMMMKMQSDTEDKGEMKE